MSDFRRSVASLLQRASSLLGAEIDEEELYQQVRPHRDPEVADLAFGCFPLAKQLRKPPVAIAEELALEVAELTNEYPLIGQARAVGPYLNFHANIGAVARTVLPAAIGGELGRSEVGKGKTILIDFSSPNVAKPFGIGHLRSTAIGAALGRLFRAQGYNVVGINHIGDWGTQFGKLISAWMRWGVDAELEMNPINHLYELYVRFHEEEKEDAELAQEGRDWFRRLEEGDEAARALWVRFREESLREFDRIYERMGVTFEHTWGEAYYEDKIDPAVERLRKAGVLEESGGATIVRVDEFYPNTSPCLIRRSDGASLYTTRDVAAALHRYETFEPHRTLYVTGADQADHFRKVFGTLKRLGLEWAERSEHIPFGRILGISTRKGTLVYLEDVFERARELSLEMMRDRELGEDERQAEAEKIGIGAVVFFDLSKERIKDAEFNWDAILQIQGRTGPGLQYTQVRLKSLIAKYEARYGELPDPDSVVFDRLVEPEIRSIVLKVSDYGREITRATDDSEPAVVSRFLLDLADLFNAFYSSGEKIVGDDAELSAARITLCCALLQVLLSGMALLGVPAPNRM